MQPEQLKDDNGSYWVCGACGFDFDSKADARHCCMKQCELCGSWADDDFECSCETVPLGFSPFDQLGFLTL